MTIWNDKTQRKQTDTDNITVSKDTIVDRIQILGGKIVTSYASANDLVHWGTNKMVCIGGDIDNKIKCYVWKGKVIVRR